MGLGGEGRLHLTVTGDNVIALFYSLDSANTARIVREKVQASKMKIEGFNVRLGVICIAMNRILSTCCQRGSPNLGCSLE